MAVGVRGGGGGGGGGGLGATLEIIDATFDFALRFFVFRLEDDCGDKRSFSLFTFCGNVQRSQN